MVKPPYVPHRRACFLRPYNDVPHLFVVLNDPCKDGQCLCVMLSSVKPNRKHDAACMLKAGDHEFIKAETYLVYRLAEVERAEHITKMVGLNYYVLKSDMSEEAFAKVLAGLHSSDETRPRLITYINDVTAAATAKVAKEKT